MKKLVFICILSIYLTTTIFAENEKSELPYALDAGGFLSYGIFETNSDDEFSNLVGIFATLLSFRAGVSVTGRYKINNLLSAGLEIGYAYMSIESDGKETRFDDVPINAVLRFGGKSTFIEGHGGYYYSDSIYGGISTGAKASLGGLYLDCSYIFGKEYSYPRITLGFQLNNII